MRAVSRFFATDKWRFSMLFSSLLLTFVLGLMQIAPGEGLTSGDVELGKQLYWRGTTAAGRPSKAVTGTGVALSGAQLSCVSCHRPSGFGSSEGGKYVPPITGPILFAPTELNRNRIFYKLFKQAQPGELSSRLREPRMRPAYTEASLAKALREGLDPANQKFDALMPRYELNDSDMTNLIAYLKTLSVTPDPGVERDTIHFATVVTDSVDPGEREAVLKTISTFFDWMNTTIEGHRDRPNFSPNYHSDFKGTFKKWQLHVWKVHGPLETWSEQIREQYAQQPVFAVVSGLVGGPWTPIARFCDSEHLPCVFPNTELPKTVDSEYGYSLYFSRGLELEAEVLSRYLAGKIPPTGSIIQVHSDDSFGLTPAAAFFRSVKSQMPEVNVQDVQVSSVEELRAVIHREANQTKAPDALVLWPGQYRAGALDELRSRAPATKIISLPADALDGAASEALSALPKCLLFTYPYDLPSSYHPRVFLVRQWMHSRKLDITYPRLQFQTYYALTLIQYGLDQIGDDYFRDYLVEAIEHEAENHLDNGTHPTLALGPGQRFASKGADIVQIDPASQGGLRALSDWIVP